MNHKRQERTTELVDHHILQHEDFFNQLRKTEYARLNQLDQVYLDYTGGSLYGNSQIRKHHELLQNNVLGNPHSTNPSSQLATRLVEETRQKVLEYFNAQDYYCVFTPNATGALKIVGECYPFGENCQFLMLADNHNSVNGIREYCKSRQAHFKYSKIRYEDLRIDAHDLLSNLKSYPDKTNKLFAFPAQSNVSGVKHNLDWIEKAQNEGWDVLLDAAAFVPTNKLDLKKHRPDYVCISFYKIFGYPTGLGCLLIRKDKFDKLHKRWFAGGTVTLASVLSPHHYLANNHERYENGTINYLDIPALKIGLEFIEKIGINRINERVQSLAYYAYQKLRHLNHSNGYPQLKIFGPADREESGGTIVMSFCNPDGSLIPFETIEALANGKYISLRSGCFCNPGIDEVNNALSSLELSDYFSHHEQGNYHDMVKYLHKMRGATRISFGIATIKEDIDQYLDFVKSLKDKVV